MDPTSYDIAQQIEYLWDLKAVMARNVTVAVIVSLLEDPLDHLERYIYIFSLMCLAKRSLIFLGC